MAGHRIPAILPFLSLLPFCSLIIPATARAAELDAKRDPRLSRKLLLRSEGFPVSRVLQRLSEKSGVTLSATGTLGDERLIAFVPDAPLAEILNSIADLYRLEWTRGSGDRPCYRLIKTFGAAREEGNLRKRCIEEALQGIARQITAQEAAPAVPTDPEDANRFALTQFALRRSRENWDRLLREGNVRIPVGSLPTAERDRIVSHLQPFLNAENASAHEERRKLIQNLRSRGVEPKDLFSPANEIGPPSQAQDGTFTIELRVHEGVELTAGIRDGKTRQYTTYGLFRSRLDHLRAAGTTLYSDRPYRPGPGGAGSTHERPHDAFSRPLQSLRSDDESRRAWWLHLEALSDASGVAIYSDDYPQRSYSRGTSSAGAQGGDTLTQALDRLCGSPNGNPWSSIWWRRGDAALVRSRAWLWEADTVLPAEFSDRLEGSLERIGTEERLSARGLPVLASLTFHQAQGLFTHGGALDAWRYAVLIPSRFGPASRNRLCRGGLSWASLLPAEQNALSGMVLPPLTGEGPRFEAYVAGSVHHGDHDSGEALHLTLKGSWGSDNVYGGIQIPLTNRNRHGLLVLASSRIDRQRVQHPRRVGALYYPWYGTPAVSGSYRHYEGVALRERRIANLAHFPSTGPYDCTDDATLRRHLQQAREAGIDFLVCSWWGRESFEHRVIERLVRLAEGSGVEIALHVEPYRGLGEARTPAALARELKLALGTLADRPAYLKVGGTPVVFIYHKAREQHDTQKWANAFELLEKELAPGILPVTESIHPADTLVFKGLRLGYWEENSRHMPSTGEKLRGLGRLVIGTVSPGMDLRHAVQDANAWFDRQKGQFYRSQWSEALDERPDWILINSFNHWEIGTEIEPSDEFGNFYLQLNARESEKFKTQPDVNGETK